MDAVWAHSFLQSVDYNQSALCTESVDLEYSTIGWLPSSVLALVGEQRLPPRRRWKIPSMCICLQAIKYGVVSTSALLRDLWSWDSFYVAGRLHKPVLFLVRDAAVDRAVAANIDAALAAALLLLPARFTAKVFQTPIRCGLPNECTD